MLNATQRALADHYKDAINRAECGFFAAIEYDRSRAMAALEGVFLSGWARWPLAGLKVDRIRGPGAGRRRPLRATTRSIAGISCSRLPTPERLVRAGGLARGQPARSSEAKAIAQFKPEDYKGPKEFVHLHAHTVYSFLDGVATCTQYAEACQKRGWSAMAATEHGHMASVPDMYLSFREQKVQYIPGCEIYYNNHHEAARVARDAKTITPQKANQSDDPAMWEDYLRYWRSRHVTILAKNQTGFENLIKLTTDANRDGMWRVNRPGRLWFNKLCEYKEGLIVLSGCLNGPIAYEFRRRAAAKIEGTDKKGKQKFRINEDGELLSLKQRRAGAAAEFLRWKKVFQDDLPRLCRCCDCLRQEDRAAPQLAVSIRPAGPGGLRRIDTVCGHDRHADRAHRRLALFGPRTPSITTHDDGD